MDTLLSEVLFFKLLRAETATRTVTTPTIVIALNVIK
ncbi:membrane protein, partial [Pluralibacter gergoviae]